MKKHLIEFKNVTKQYKMGEVSINALNNVNFSIDEGEFTIILGASGAGKSTILNLLGGMDTLTSGTILVDGEDITKLDDKKLTEYRAKNVGFVFQFYNLIANLNALENVEFASEVCDNALDSKDVLKQVGLGDRLKNFPSQLSGGEQQRVAIARAVAKNPLILLCDEPTGALDYKTGKSVLELLSSLNKKTNKTIILITHNSALAPIADKVIKVQSGTIQNVTINQNKKSIQEVEW